MSLYSLTVSTLFLLASITVRTTDSKKICGTAAISGLKESSTIRTPVRDNILAARKTIKKVHLASSEGLGLVKRSASDDDDDCGSSGEAAIHEESAGIIPKKTTTVEIPLRKSEPATENSKKKTTISSLTPDLKTLVSNIIKPGSLAPLKHLLIQSETGSKKSLDTKNSISSLIAAVKARENLTIKPAAPVISAAPVVSAASSSLSTNNNATDSVKKGSVSDAAVAPSTTADSVRRGNLDEKVKSKVADAGKSILAAIDDKEGLRAALAKAIDRVEKVVANKNGVLAPKKGAEKKNETKPAVTTSSAAANATQSAVNTTATADKSTDISNTTVSRNATVAAEPEKAPVKAVEKDPYAEIAMGPDKPKIPELKGEDGETPGGGSLMKLGDQGVQSMGDGAGAAAAAAGGGGGGKMEPLAGMHDVGGLLDSLTDKVNLADTKGSLVQQPLAGVGDPGGMLDRAQDKFSQMEDKGETRTDPGVQDPGGLLDRATEKFNRLGGGVASQNNDVKYIQSELEGAGGLEDPPSSKLQTKIPTSEAVKHIEDAIKQDGPKPGDDDPLKAFGAAGNDISASLQAYKNSFPLKSLPKAAESSVFQSLMKQQQQARGTSRGIGEGLEDGLPKTLKDISEGIDDLHPENVMRNSKQLGGDEDPAAGQLISKVASAEPESFMKEAASQPDKDAGDLTADSKGGVGEDTFKELQDADISGGPDPYLNDQKDNGQNADSGNSMFAGAGDLQQAGKPPKFSDDAPYGDMMSADDGIRNFAPRAPPQDTFGDMYDKDDMDNPPQTPESYYNMGNSDDQFRSRQSIPRNVLWGATNRESDDDDNLSTQIFKRNIIMRPKKDNYVSPFKGKRSFEFDP